MPAPDEITALMIQQIRDIEHRDEKQIMAELAGETLDEYIYETIITVKGERRRKVRLSWVGVREVARSRGNILLDDPIITESEDAWRIVIKATDITRNFSVFGGCHQPKLMKVNILGQGGEIIGHNYEPDEFSFQKGLSKAQRNALDKCIPADLAAKSIDRFLRSLGRPPLLKRGDKKKEAATKEKTADETALTAPPKAQIKPREEWDKITQDMIPNYPSLEHIIWDLCKIQPAEMYKELGFKTRADANILPWEAFLQLRERFAPANVESKP